MATQNTPELVKEHANESLPERRADVLLASRDRQVGLLEDIDKQRKREKLQELPDRQGLFV